MASTGEGDFIKTVALNYVSRKTSVHGARNVEMKGRSVIMHKALIRGDFAPVRIGRYTTIGEATIIRPPPVSVTKKPTTASPAPSIGIKFAPLVLGSHCSIGTNCVIESAYLGSCVRIGNNCILGKRCVIKDNCVVEDGTILAPDTVIPPFSIVAGKPGRIVAELPESAATELVATALQNFNQFVEDVSQQQ